MLSDKLKDTASAMREVGLNAPYGARCFLTLRRRPAALAICAGFNAPYGARCFLTGKPRGRPWCQYVCLNAPYGARCFLTLGLALPPALRSLVLMHLMALGAF